MSVEPPSCGGLCRVDCDLGPNLEVDTDVDADAAEASPDIQGQRRTASCRIAALERHPRAQYWPAIPRVAALRTDVQMAVEVKIVDLSEVDGATAKSGSWRCWGASLGRGLCQS